MTEKIIIVRKPHKCAYCGEEIPKGAEANFLSDRMPKYDSSDEQTGIIYQKWWLHSPKCTEEDDN